MGDMITAGKLDKMFKKEFEKCKLKATRKIIFFNKITGDQLQCLEMKLKSEFKILFRTKICLVEDKKYVTGEIYYKNPADVR